MKTGLGICTASSIFLFTAAVWAQAPTDGTPPKISLVVPSQAPLRLYLTNRVPKKVGAPVEAKLLESVYAFDREVVPAGSIAQGTVRRVVPVPRRQRVKAIVNGDFTPLHKAEIQFDTLMLPDGRKLATHTVETVGLISIYTEPSKKKSSKKTGPQTQNGGVLGTAKQTMKDQVSGAINARTQGIADIVRGPNKKEKLVDLMWSKLPYHPQYLRRGTRFDALLQDPLEFGTEAIQLSALAEMGSQPRADSVARVRLLTPLDSASAKTGTVVEAVVVAPLFSADHKLVLPEGTRLTGTVVVAKGARSFHRPGQLRFTFQRFDLPEQVASLRAPAAERAPMKTVATLEGAEGSGPAPIKVDSEGGVEAKESKTRFIAPIIALMLASRAADNDADRHHDNGVVGDNANVSGRTLGGGLGFGLLGAAASQSSRYVGMAFGYYGLAWSVYSNVIARGGEVQFEKDAMMDIKFGARTAPAGSKFHGGGAVGGQ